MEALLAALPAWASHVSGVLRAAPPLSLLAPAHADAALIALASLCACALLAAAQPRGTSLLQRSCNLSTVHSIVVVVLAVLAYHEAPQLLWDASGRVWTHTSDAALLPVAITLGYITFDCLLGLLSPGLLKTAMWLHHAVVLASFLSGVAFGFGTTYQALFLVNEASTVPLNLHVAYGDGWKATRPRCRTANGAALWLTYLLCRILANTMLSASVVTTSSAAVREGFPFAWRLSVAVLFTLTALNAMWFYQITL